MTIYAPNKPGPSQFDPMIIENSSTLTPFLGGVDQRINRLGDRFGVVFATPQMDHAISGDWIAFLMAARTQEAAVRWIEPDTPRRSYGTPRVAGGSQAGTSLAIDGLPARARLEAGKFFSILDGGRRSLHTILTRATANSSGAVTVTFWPMLRFSPSDNAVVELEKPYIQGIIRPSETPWTTRLALFSGVSFQLVEAR
jgi:hypothetical protein